MDHGNDENNDWFYRIHITERGKVVTRTARHVKQTLISAEQYIRDQMA